VVIVAIYVSAWDLYKGQATPSGCTYSGRGRAGWNERMPHVNGGLRRTVAGGPTQSECMWALCGRVERESQTWKAEVDERALPFPLANCLGPALCASCQTQRPCSCTPKKNLVHVEKICSVFIKSPLCAFWCILASAHVTTSDYQRCALICGRSLVMRHTNMLVHPQGCRPHLMRATQLCTTLLR
jgi:hypothetical protein